MVGCELVLDILSDLKVVVRLVFFFVVGVCFCCSWGCGEVDDVERLLYVGGGVLLLFGFFCSLRCLKIDDFLDIMGWWVGGVYLEKFG